MANPGYPMGPNGGGGMGHGGMGGPPMGGPPMGGPPMGGPPMGGPPSNQMRPPVMRQGTSKAVPVVVSAGLAVGVFCGLLFGLGTGDKVQAAPSTGTNAKAGGTATTDEVIPEERKIDPNIVGLANKVDKSAGSGSDAAAGSGSAAGSADAAMAGSGSAVAATVPPPPAHPKLTVELMPPSVAATATITVDGKPLTGMTYEVDLAGQPKKEVSVVVKAKDYKDIEQKVTVDGDMTLKLELIKQRTKSSVGTYTPPKTGGSSGGGRKSGGGKKKPDNQIDI